MCNCHRVNCLLFDSMDLLMMLYLVRVSRVAVRINAGEASMAAELGSCNRELPRVGNLLLPPLFQYLPHRKHCLNYRDQPVNVVWGDSRCLL
jgi:hypothetical protein